MNDQRELRDVPVYTLPEYVLFPHTLVPLHVTEPDQIQLAEDCLAGDRQLVIAGLQPGWEDYFEVAAPIYRTGCLAKVVNEERIQNGSISLFVHGLSRAVIHHQVRTEPYRTAHIELIPDQVDAHRELHMHEAWTRLHALVSELSRSLGSAARPLGRVLNERDGLGALTYRVAAMFVGEEKVRQQLLAESCPLIRESILTDVLGSALLQLLETHGFDKVVN